MSTVDARAPVLEVFSSIQGEGLFTGELQVFLRLWGCPLRCHYCDTPHSWKVPSQPSATIQACAGERREDALATPFSVACWIAECEPFGRRTLSITGGEPLLWPHFIRSLKPFLAERRVHLETSGSDPDTLLALLGVVDHVSLDLKLAADLAAPTGVTLPSGMPANPEASAPHTEQDWRAIRAQLLPALADRDAALKLVICGETDELLYRGLLEEAAELAPHLPVFIQPATPMGRTVAPALEALISLAEEARELDLDVRILPQLHPLLQIP